MSRRVWRLLLIVAASLAGLTQPARAQSERPVGEQVTFEPGFSFLRSFGETGIGFSGYVNDPFKKLQNGGTLGVVGGIDFHNFEFERDLSVRGGVRFTLKSQSKITPFVQGLAGVAHSSGKDCFGGCSESNFQAAAGGGVFVAMTPRVYFDGLILLDLDRRESAGEVTDVGGIIGVTIFLGLSPLYLR